MMLKLQNIKKSFFGVEVLHGVTLEAEGGRVTSLVGENGAGKSTLMKVISGVHTDYKGEIFIDGERVFFKNPREAEHHGISIIHQELSCIPDLTVAENIFLGKEPVNKFGFIRFERLFKDAESILREFEFPYPPDTKVRNISVGWQQIVEIAHAFSSDARIVILDEPTSSLTRSEIDILFEKVRLLKQKGKAIIFISHRLEEIYEIADEIAILRDGVFVGKYPSSEISRSALISKIVGRNVSDETTSKPVMNTETVLAIRGLKVFRKKRTYLSGVSFELSKGEVLGVTGLMGSGKSELLRFIFGALKAEYEGEIILGKEAYRPMSALHSIANRIFYLPGDRKTEGIFKGLNLIRNSSISVLSMFSSFGFLKEGAEASAVVEQTSRLNVKMHSLNQAIETLSGGNQQKILLGRGLMNAPKLFLLDEPTRGIDVGAKEEIYNLITNLSNARASFIVSSSDITELLRVSNRILVLFHGEPKALLNFGETNTSEILHYSFNEARTEEHE